MSYFVTGATGFIGRHLVELLLKRKGKIYCLVRRGSTGKLDELRERWGVGEDRVVTINGDLGRKNLGLSQDNLDLLKGKVKHFFHLAAIYDLAKDADSQAEANIEGTKHAVELAETLRVGVFHHTSSIAVAGVYSGMFREDMFDEAEGLSVNPYFRAKHDSEAIVRRECKRPYRIYRPGMVVGHSKTGEMDKVDGPYYFFKLIQRLRGLLPPWMPTIGLEGGRMNIVPVDFVAAAMDHIGHTPGEDGNVFHLTDPSPKRIGEVLNLFCEVGHAPKMSMRLDARMFNFIPSGVRQGLSMLPPVKRVSEMVLKDLGIPSAVMKFINYPTRFDSRNTERVLKGTSIKVPKLDKYAAKLWDYWERNLDPDLFLDRSLRGRVKDKVCVVTGASAGIGLATAQRLASAGAKVILAARDPEKLAEAKQKIEESGGTAFSYSVDLADLSSADAFVKAVLADHGGVDYLINNAGRSIRRSIASSFDRFHDFERTMQLNYFGCLRLIMGFMPSMMEKKRGHVINISSIGVLTNAPRFSAYVASKAALDAFSRCAASELHDSGLTFTTINMPLVRTEMIAPTKIYENVPTLSTDEAADMVQEAIIRKPQRIATRLGIFAAVLHALFPKPMEVFMNFAFKLFPDSSAARGIKEPSKEASSEQVAFASLMRGVHW
jgi:NAD(P)-dependent dehydrogenase (short-subunit alcohol dehydrogenase family)